MEHAFIIMTSLLTYCVQYDLGEDLIYDFTALSSTVKKVMMFFLSAFGSRTRSAFFSQLWKVWTLLLSIRSS